MYQGNMNHNVISKLQQLRRLCNVDPKLIATLVFTSTGIWQLHMFTLTFIHEHTISYYPLVTNVAIKHGHLQRWFSGASRFQTLLSILAVDSAPHHKYPTSNVEPTGDELNSAIWGSLFLPTYKIMYPNTMIGNCGHYGVASIGFAQVPEQKASWYPISGVFLIGKNKKSLTQQTQQTLVHPSVNGIIVTLSNLWSNHG